MNFDNILDITQSQKLCMTISMKQSLNILNMSNIELEEEIKKEEQENPLLEIIDTYIEQDQFKSNYHKNDYLNLENVISNKENLYEHIKKQLVFLEINENEKKICEYIINSLDENGYLNVNEEYIIKKLKIDRNRFDKCLKYVQSLEPIGIGARNLIECLLIQLRVYNFKDNILKRIIEEDLNLISENKMHIISKKYNISINNCEKYIKIIKNLNPKPGKIYGNEKIIYIRPDIVIKKIENDFFPYIYNQGCYSIKINNYYKSILENNESNNELKTYIKDKLSDANNFIKSIENRKNTILKIAEVIIKKQNEFFLKGIDYIKPMKLKDIALELGYHESTISRGINNKYMLTSYGMFELKYFFSKSIKSQKEGEVSSKKVKSIIKNLIKSENKLKPLSDDKICKLLNKQGIIVSRRTVTKYRIEMNILSSYKRKQFYNT